MGLQLNGRGPVAPLKQNNMYYVYVLISHKDNKRYIGQTSEINNRITEHINGFVKATKYRLPLDCVYLETYNTRKEAMNRESYLKSYNGWKELSKIIDNLGLQLNGRAIAS